MTCSKQKVMTQTLHTTVYACITYDRWTWLNLILSPWRQKYDQFEMEDSNKLRTFKDFQDSIRTFKVLKKDLGLIKTFNFKDFQGANHAHSIKKIKLYIASLYTKGPFELLLLGGVGG